MNKNITGQLEGGCTCGEIRYRLKKKPLIVHCCHCSWCQKESGSAFALNAMIEAEEVELIQGQAELTNNPSPSGKGQKFYRCPTCKITLWSNYAGGGDALRFVRQGTLDDPNQAPPDMNIFTSTKQDWLQLSDDLPAFEEYYSAAEHWPEDSLRRIKAIKPS